MTINQRILFGILSGGGIPDPFPASTWYADDAETEVMYADDAQTEPYTMED